ncbi:MAG: MMPL family transporter [Halioglobus sp.]
MVKNSLRLAFGVWLALLLVGVVRVLQGDFYLQSDLMSLLPEDESGSVARIASEKLTGEMGDDFIFLLQTADLTALVNSTQYLEQRIAAADFMQPIDQRQRVEQQLAYTRTLLAHRNYLLTPQQTQVLHSEPSERMLNRAIQAMYDPSAMSAIVPVSEDPLGLFSDYVLSTGPELPDFFPVGDTMVLEEAGIYSSLVQGRAVPGSFSLDAQEAMQQLQVDLAAHLSSRGGVVKAYASGGIFHGAKAATSAKKEMAIIGGGSSLGIFLLFFYCFRSARPLLLSLSSIAFGCVAALIVCANVYGSLHLITLVFGASLIGVSVDYSLHFITSASNDTTATTGTAPIVSSIGLAMLTSILGYSSLLQAPLQGLQEMALFSMVGLFSSGLFVLCLFPRWHNHRLGRPPAPAALTWLACLPGKLWERTQPLSRLWLVLLLILPAAVVGLMASSDSNIRVFHTPDTALLEQQQHIETVLPRRAPNQFFLIEGSDAQALLENAEGFKAVLDGLRSRGAISGYQLLSDALPSVKRQLEARALLDAGVYAEGGEADRFFQQVGFDAGVARQFRKENAEALPLTVDTWLASAPEHLQSTWLGRIDGRFYSLVLLDSVHDLQPLHSAARANPSVAFVDTVAAISNNLSQRFDAALRLLLVAYAVIALLMLLRYRRPAALTLVLVPLVSSLLTIAMLSALAIPINLFHLFALFLVLGLGMDYGIFQFESANHVDACRLAILLSVLTSCLGFGLLALSDTPMISAFGLAVLLGSVANWLLVPLVGPLDFGEKLEKKG